MKAEFTANTPFLPMSNLPIIYPIALGFALGFLACVVACIAYEWLNERRQRKELNRRVS